jgi:AAHS family 4-hydroxybenzoate transporter-like MFS transporter
MRLNVGSWLLFSGLTFIASAFNGWGTVFLTVAGFTLEQAVTTTVAFNSLAVLAALATMLFLGRVGSRGPLVAAPVLAVAAVLLMTSLLGTGADERSHADTVLAAIASGFAGFATGCGLATVYGLLSFGYPSEYRSTGLGMAMMMGRIGGILIALFGGAFLALDGANTRPFFLILAGVGVLGLAGALLINRHVPGSRSGASGADTMPSRKT